MSTGELLMGPVHRCCSRSRACPATQLSVSEDLEHGHRMGAHDGKPSSQVCRKEGQCCEADLHKASRAGFTSRN